MYPNYPTMINEAQLAIRWGVGTNTMRKKRQDGTMPLPYVQNCFRGTVKYETKDVLKVEAEHGERPFRSRLMPAATATPVEPASIPLPALSTPPAPSPAPTDVTAIAELLAEVIEARVTAALDASRRRMIAQLTAP